MLFSYEYVSKEAINWFSFMKWVISTGPRHAYSTLRYFKALKYLNEVLLDNISKIWGMEMLFSYGYASVGATNSVLSSGYFLLLQDMPIVR